MTATTRACGDVRRETPTLFDLPEPAATPPAKSATTVTIAGQTLDTTAVFDTYWRFAATRQALYESRLAGAPGPWTTDPVLRRHRFTNCFRAADRVSQYLIRDVAYTGTQEPREVVFRVLLFKLFNKVSTWELLVERLGRQPSWEDFDLATYDKVLSEAFSAGQRLYSAAYVVPPPSLGAERKHTNHLRLLALMMQNGVTRELQDARTMHQAFETLRTFPAIGDFLAFQFLIDINYSTVLDFDEMEFVVAGPGARDGIRKCFGPRSRGIEADVIRYMADHQEEHFARLGLRFSGLRGRPLQLIDCQNLFCEVDKYSRVVHPDVAGISGRTRIKQKFTPVTWPLSAWFPPKWGINVIAHGKQTLGAATSLRAV
jgi:hypothetical protein